MSRATKRAAPPTLAACLRQMRQEFPRIRPFQEPEDEVWWDEGLQAFQTFQLDRAEQLFKQLTLAQPEHFDGYYGLGLVYARRGRLDLARLFADEAVRLGQVFMDAGSLDPDTMAELQALQQRLTPAPGSGV